jgi:hypothetical protein
MLSWKHLSVLINIKLYFVLFDEATDLCFVGVLQCHVITRQAVVEEAVTG